MVNPARISIERLRIELDIQMSPIDQGGVGEFARFSFEHPSWQRYIRHRVPPFIDFYSGFEGDVKGAAISRGRKTVLGALSPRGSSVSDGHDGQLVLVPFRGCDVAPIFSEASLGRLWVLSCSSLVGLEIGLSQLVARHGHLVHVVACVEDQPQTSVHLQRADQWTHEEQPMTTGAVWVADVGSGMQRMLVGSKWAHNQETRMWRQAWRKRPESPGVVIVEYWSGSSADCRKEMRRNQASKKDEREEEGVKVFRESSLFRQSDEPVLGVHCGRDVVVTHERASLMVWSATTAQPLRRIPVSARRVRVWGFQVFLVGADDPPIIHVYDLINPNARPLLLQCPDHVAPADIQIRTMGPMRQLTVMGVGAHRMIHLWTVPREAGSRPEPPSTVLEGHTDYVTCVDSNSESVFSGSCDCSVRVWEPTTGTLIRTMTGHTDWVFSICWVQSIRSLVSASRDGSVRIWDCNNGSCLKSVSPDGTRAFSLTLQPSQPFTIALALGSGRAACLSPSSLSSNPILCGQHNDRMSQLIWWRSCIVSSASDSSIRIWDASSGKCAALLKSHSDTITGMCLMGDTLFSSSDDGTVRCWHLSSALPDVITSSTSSSTSSSSVVASNSLSSSPPPSSRDDSMITSPRAKKDQPAVLKFFSGGWRSPNKDEK